MLALNEMPVQCEGNDWRFQMASWATDASLTGDLTLAIIIQLQGNQPVIYRIPNILTNSRDYCLAMALWLCTD